MAPAGRLMAGVAVVDGLVAVPARTLVLAVMAAILALAAALVLLGGSDIARAQPPSDGQLDHFQCYSVDGAHDVKQKVTLTDQFASNQRRKVGEAVAFCNPVRKTY